MTNAAIIDHLNDLLRGELSATETYQQALGKIGTENGAADLRRIHAEHREAANTLRQHVHHFGGKPDQGSGVWGAFAKAVEGSAKIFGNTAAVKALKEGEKIGLKSYEDALKSKDLANECILLIQSKLIPQTKEHITALDHLTTTA